MKEVNKLLFSAISTLNADVSTEYFNGCEEQKHYPHKYPIHARREYTDRK